MSDNPETQQERQPQVGSDRLVMPCECGRYLWDDEPVAIIRDANGELVAQTADCFDSPEEIDRMLRDENAEHYQTSPERPWLLVGECCDDECFGHNAKNAGDPPTKTSTEANQ